MPRRVSLSLPLFQRLFLSNSDLPGTPVPTRTIQPSDPRHALEASKNGERRSRPATLWWLGVKILIKHSAYKLRCPRGGWRGLTDKIESDARNQQSLPPATFSFMTLLPSIHYIPHPPKKVTVGVVAEPFLVRMAGSILPSDVGPFEHTRMPSGVITSEGQRVGHLEMVVKSWDAMSVV